MNKKIGLSTSYPQIYQQKNSQEIYKSNRLIESSYQLTTAQNRLIYMAMTKLKRIILDKNTNIEEVELAIKQSKFDLIYIDVIDYKKKFKIKSNRIYAELESIASSLYEEEILYINEETKDFGRTRWLITCEYDNQQKGVKIEFNPKLIRDLLIFTGGYTKMLFDNFVDKLKSKHAFRIYELCKQYLKIGYRDFYVEDLKFKLRIFGDSYASYASFKQRIIKKAIEEINKHTDLYIEYIELEKNKKTRKVKKIRFIIREQQMLEEKNPCQIDIFKNKEIALTIDDGSIVGEITQIINYPEMLSAKDANDIYISALFGIDNFKLKTGVKDYIRKKKVVVDNYIVHKQQKGEKINYIGAIIKALRENWQINYDQNKNNNSLIDKFNEFPQRKYDYDKLEKKLLGWE